MAALPPPPPLASGPGRPSPSIPFVDSMEVDGGVPQRGTDGIGDGGDTQRRTDGGGEPKMCTDAGGGKRLQTPATGSCLVPTIMKASRDEMKDVFKNYASRISLTGDMWTSNQKLGHFCLTCHFISDSWVLHIYIIRFAMLETPHNSVNMFNLVLNSLQEWNLEDKLFSFTLDNAAVNTAMVNSLRKNLKTKGFLVLEGKLLHFHCATYVFNLIVQDGLKVIKNIVNNIRESVKYVRSSQSRVEKFVGIIIQEGLPAVSPCPDVTSRWNSTFLMLEAALPLRNAFQSLKIKTRSTHLLL